MKRSNIIVGVMFLVIILGMPISAPANEQVKLVELNDSTLGWDIFGSQADEASIVKQKNELKVQIEWSKTSWGLGMSHMLDLPMNGTKIKSVRAEIKTQSNNKIHVHAGLSTKSGGNLSQNMRLAAEITNDWKEFEFLVTEMATDTTQPLSPTFGNRNWDKIKVVNLFFLKPRNGELGTDTILIRNPTLIYSDDDVYARN